jgi:hypothetical protein
VNDDPAIVAAPLLDLRSGYIQRAKDRMPQQGSRPPWQVYQSYLQDYRATRRADVDDGVVRFTNPVQPAERDRPTTVAAG